MASTRTESVLFFMIVQIARARGFFYINSVIISHCNEDKLWVGFTRKSGAWQAVNIIDFNPTNSISFVFTDKISFIFEI
jgi:hypothetical protein